MICSKKASVQLRESKVFAVAVILISGGLCWLGLAASAAQLPQRLGSPAERWRRQNPAYEARQPVALANLPASRYPNYGTKGQAPYYPPEIPQQQTYDYKGNVARYRNSATGDNRLSLGSGESGTYQDYRHDNYYPAGGRKG